MSILSSLLPGVRELRTPLTVGSLWIAFAALIAFPSAGWLRNLHAVANVSGTVAMFPPAVQTAGLAFAAYVVGMVADGLGVWVERSGLVTALVNRMRSSGRRSIAQVATKYYRPNAKAEALVLSSVRERLRPISSTLVSYVSGNIVLDEFDLARLRLSRDAFQQYQHYDRVRAEADLRTGIAPPLLALTTVFGTMLPLVPGLLVGVAGGILAAMVLFQGFEHREQADEYMASAIYFGYTSTPMFDTLVEAAKAELKPNRTKPATRDLAWISDFLADRGMLAVDHEFMSKLRHPSGILRRALEDALPMMRPQTRAQFAFMLPGILETKAESGAEAKGELVSAEDSEGAPEARS